MEKLSMVHLSATILEIQFMRTRIGGVIFYGSVRDIEGLAEIGGFNAWIKGYDPSYIQQMMLAGINVPVRIGRATVLPGDAVLAKKGGIIFIPAQLVEEVVINAEFIELRDEFGHQRLREGKYTPGQIDAQWSDEIKKDFLQWIKDNPFKSSDDTGRTG
jgi:regulator of RNase E activity RraA